jgi:excisionase family DNA binding protein
MTPKEVAKLLKLHLKTIYKLAAAGEIPARRVGRSWRFSRSEVIGSFGKRESGKQ